ncbi:hypothetical protein [uncultured Winogradskyella sp.]|uniref:hypothetical protein n=1 Tax=uncultured Winogradskyella sp. TaxID=395353 RepID=UPI0030D89B91|tara:strand:+ start:8023 stop:8277 length:255 start_codon:yes stop_codon:yes gene_type:complete
MAIQAMITILKNNDRMMHKRTKFKKTFGGYGKNRKTEYDLPKATPKQLRDIRQKFKEENQLLLLKVIGFSTIIILGLVWLLFIS